MATLTVEGDSAALAAIVAVVVSRHAELEGVDAAAGTRLGSTVASSLGDARALAGGQPVRVFLEVVAGNVEVAIGGQAFRADSGELSLSAEDAVRALGEGPGTKPPPVVRRPRPTGAE